MGCGCNKKNGQPSAFVWNPPPGSDQKPKEVRTEVEARAAVIRHGGTWAPK